MPGFPDLVNRYVQEAFRLFPTYATYFGVHDYDDRLESFSPELNRGHSPSEDQPVNIAGS